MRLVIEKLMYKKDNVIRKNIMIVNEMRKQYIIVIFVLSN